MMDIVMLVAGAGVGAMLRDLFVLRRGGEGKTRQQLDSKTPYDYALTNAINERDRLRDELVTLRAINNVQTETERIRNEIGTILSDDGEEASESLYESNIGMPIQDNGDGTFSPILLHAGELDTSPITAVTGLEAGEWADIISKKIAKACGTNVREDVSIGERLSDKDVERSLTKAVRDSFENNEGIRVFWEDSHGRARSHYGSANEIQTANGKVKYFSVRGLEFSARDVLRITKGRRIDGETLYRKGNR